MRVRVCDAAVGRRDAQREHAVCKLPIARELPRRRRFYSRAKQTKVGGEGVEWGAAEHIESRMFNFAR